MNTIPSLTVIIPAFNEMHALNDAIDEVVTTLDGFGICFEILVVNDGSTDESQVLLEHRASCNHRIKIINHPQNFGKGKSLRSGFENSEGYDWFLLIDADLQIPLTWLASFAEASSTADVVIGNRIEKHYTPVRKMISFLNRLLVSVLFDIKVRDVNCPFKLLKRDLVKNITLSANGFGIDAELLWKLTECGAVIIELPVDSRPRKTGRSKVTPLVLINCVLELVRLKYRTEPD